MTVNVYFALNSVFAPVYLAPDRTMFENNCVITNKDRPILSSRIIFGKESSFWQYKVYADIRGGSLGGASNDSEVVNNGNFQYFRWLFLWKL